MRGGRSEGSCEREEGRKGGSQSGRAAEVLGNVPSRLPSLVLRVLQVKQEGCTDPPHPACRRGGPQGDLALSPIPPRTAQLLHKSSTRVWAA